MKSCLFPSGRVDHLLLRLHFLIYADPAPKSSTHCHYFAYPKDRKNGAAVCRPCHSQIVDFSHCEVNMLKFTMYRSGLAAIWISILLAGCASPKTQEEAKTTVNEAEATLAEFLRDPDMTWLQKNIPNAKAVLVSPKILQAGFIVGGSGGNGVALARAGTPQAWHGPAFYKLSTGSVGFQAGAQSSEMVILVMSDKALNSLLSNSFKLGGDVSVAAGPIGAGAGTPINSDMVSFVRSKGLYGGLNLDGTVISIDEEGNRNFYGRPASPVDILVKGSVTNPNGAPLARVISRYGTASGTSPSGTSSSGTR
jgi:SH3 domain-containing YSC84-like protein 1